MSIKNDGHYFCRAGGNRPDGLNEPVTVSQLLIELELKDLKTSFHSAPGFSLFGH
ncbi:copper resistance protein [Escherichia coli]|nr:copper resistance protein [Escherichia coli]